MVEVVLDASALLALLNGEPGSDRVRAVLPGAVMSAVNVSEVLAVLAGRGIPLDEADAALADLPLDIRPFDRDGAKRAAALFPTTRTAGLSLGDRACLALAASLDLPAVTADRAWKDTCPDLAVEVIR